MVYAGYKTFFSPVAVTVQSDGTYALAINGEEPDEMVAMWRVTAHSMRQMNIWVLFLLVPTYIWLFYSEGQIYFAFLRQHKGFKLSRSQLMRISLEINFVNQALPSGGASGLAYLMWRLKDLNITAGQVGFVHGLRYAICVWANTVQTLIAIVIVTLTHSVREEGRWVVWFALAIAVVTEVFITLIFVIASKKRYIDWFSRNFVRGINKIVGVITFGKRKNMLKKEKFERFFGDLHQDYLKIRQNRRILWKPIFWGGLYSFLELAAYWVVGIALGHPEIMPQVMLAEGAAGAVSLIWPTPGGVGGYEATMIMVMYLGGADLSIATIVVIATRVCTIAGTFLSGWGLYQHALLSRKDKFSIEEKIGSK